MPSDLVGRLTWMAEHTRRTSKGGMEAEARLFEEAASALRAGAEPATPASGWMPIESAPTGEYDTIIMGFAPDEEGYAPAAREGFWSHETSGWRLTSDPEWKSNPQPTHWQPLPTPPASKGGE